MNKTALFKWGMSFGLPLLVYALFPAGAAGPKAALFMAVTVWAVTAWALEILPSIAVAAALTFLYVLFGVAEPKVIFAPWGTFLPWFALASLIIGDAIMRSGLGKRIALKGMLTVGPTFGRTMFGMLFAGLAMALIIPAVLARVVLFITMAQGLCQALDVDPKSRTSSAFILGAYMAAISPGITLLTANDNNIMGMQMFSQVVPAVEWFSFASHNLLFGILYAVMSMSMVFVVRGKERIAGEDQLGAVILARYTEMGPMTAMEYKVLFILVGSVLAFMTEKWHGVPAPYIFGMGSLLCYIPILRISDESNLKSLNFGFLIFLTACQSIGFAAGAAGINKWLSGFFAPLLQGESESMAVLLTYIGGIGVNFLLTPMAALGSFAAPLAQIGLDAGVSPAALLYAFLYGLDQCIFPYEIGYFLFIFMTGAITLKHIIPAMTLRMILGGMGLMALQVPYWKLIGLL